MRASLPALFLLPVALTGCPALLSDWTISGGPADDASADDGGYDAAGDSSSGASGSFDGSIDADAGQAPGDSTAPESMPEASESGSSDSGPATTAVPDTGPSDDASPSDTADAGPCGDGGPLYPHDVGVDGLTWQDCVPTSTYDEAQALQACTVYAAANSLNAAFCVQGQLVCGNGVLFDEDSLPIPIVVWVYDMAVLGHVAMTSRDSLKGFCPSAQDPSWD